MYDSIKITGSHMNAYVMAEKKNVDLIQDSADSSAHDLDEDIKNPLWNIKTYMLAKYEDEETLLSGSNYTSISQITGYKIFREENGVLYYVQDVDSTQKSIQDFNTKGNTKQSFYIYPKILDDGKSVLSSPIISEPISPVWDCWSVIGLNKVRKNVYTVDVNNIWNFEVNIKSDSIKDNVRRQVHNTYSRFPKVMYGKQRYKEGSLSCLLGSISHTDCEYNDSVELMDKWDEFVNNREIKLLKAPKGIVYPVDIYDSVFNIQDGYHNEAIELSFSYVQLDDSNNISVYLL